MDLLLYITAMIFSVACLGYLGVRKSLLLKRDEKLQAELKVREAHAAKEAMKKEIQTIEMAHIPERKHKNTAIKEADAKKKKVPKIVAVCREADTAFNDADFETAKKGFIQVLSLQHDHADAMNKLAIIYIKEADYPRAELLLKKLIKKATKAVYWSNLGLVLYHQNKHREAIVAYEKAIAADPKRSQRYVSLSRIYFELKNNAKSFDCLKKAHKRDPKNLELLFEIVAFAEQQNDVAGQKKYLTIILDNDPYNEEAKKLIGKVSESVQTETR